MGWKRVGAVILTVALTVVGCTNRVTDVAISRAADHPLLRYLPTLADVPGMVEVGYDVPRNDEFSVQRRTECARYPEPGDPEGPQLSAHYRGSIDRDGRLIDVELWRTRPGEDIVDEMAAWGTRCGTYRDVYGTWDVRTFRNIPGMPTDAIQFDTTQTAGDKYWKPSDDGPDGRTVVVARDGVVLRVRFISRGPLGVTVRDVAQLVNGFVRRAAEQAPDTVQTSSVASWPAARLSALVMTPPIKSGSRVVQLSSQATQPGDAPSADCSADPLLLSRPGADPLVDALEVATVFRERDGFDGITAVNDWVKRCSAQPFVPEVCADKAKDGHLEAIPPVRIEGELVSGYQGVLLGESYVKTTKYCQPKSVVAQVVRVRGILLRAAPLVVDRAEGEDQRQARQRAIDEQRQQLAYVIHGVQRAQ